MAIPVERTPVEHVGRPEYPYCGCANSARQVKRPGIIADYKDTFLQEGRQGADPEGRGYNGGTAACLLDFGDKSFFFRGSCQYDLIPGFHQNAGNFGEPAPGP